MTSSSSANFNPNLVLEDYRDLLALAREKDSFKLLKDLKYDWQNNVLNVNSKIYQIFVGHNLIERRTDGTGLTRYGRLILSRLILPFNVPEMNGATFKDVYDVECCMNVGKNSAIFLARHKLLNYDVILKFIRPGASEDTINSIHIIGKADAKAQIIRPIDYFNAAIKDVFGKNVVLDCIVYPKLNGITFKKYLTQKNYHLNSRIVSLFVKQVGYSLAELERIGAYHGDLHDENILVDEQDDGKIDFRVIDISFGCMGSMSYEDCKNSDLTNFRQHIWRLLSMQKSFLPRMSLRKYLGARQYVVIKDILSDKFIAFQDILKYMNDNSRWDKYIEEKRLFLTGKFFQPTTFRLQRYEEIIDPSVATRLFVPFPELMAKITEFCNAYVSGNRGSGKSTYLAALAFFPHAEDLPVNYREIFGIYFPCRQGEFKSLTSAEGWTNEEVSCRTTQIVIVKIIRRALEAIAGGITTNKISNPSDYLRLRLYLNRFLPPPGLVSIPGDTVLEIENIVSTMVRVEMELLATFKTRSVASNTEYHPSTLIDFFDSIRNVFPELASTRFHILFDDAGEPNLPINVQRTINDLIMTSNPLFCVKWSAEKFTFLFECSLGKIPENGHDYFEHDISHTLFIGSTTARMAREDLEKHFRNIVKQRLEYFKYKDNDIVSYLGDNKNIADQLIGLLAASRRDARYAGWTAVWNIADRTPRYLLEIVSEIFSYAEVTKESTPKEISNKIQDKAIRTISEKRLQSLSQIAGVITQSKRRYSLGRRLYEVATTIGSVFHIYLKNEQGRARKRQYLAIERNDLASLAPESEVILKKLITYGVLDDSKSEFARDDEVIKPIYVLNRIYCPAFRIIYRRDEHLRLSKTKFEMLLMDPQQFMREGTKRLRNNPEINNIQSSLFGYSVYE
jgi:serine/threonine protein kinase